MALTTKPTVGDDLASQALANQREQRWVMENLIDMQIRIRDVGDELSIVSALQTRRVLADLIDLMVIMNRSNP